MNFSIHPPLFILGEEQLYIIGDFNNWGKFNTLNDTSYRVNNGIVSLSNIERVCVLDEKNKKELREASKGRKVFSYYPQISPEREVFVFVTECGEKLLLKISPDDTMLEILNGAVGE